MKLTATSLACERGGRIVFRDLSFAATTGDALVVTGPNGIGKSTLLRLIAGLLQPLHGSLDFAGSDRQQCLAEQCHYFGHQDAVKPALSVRENAQFWQRFLGASGSALESALSQLGLARIDHLPAAYLSAGQRRRLALTRLILTHRPIWLMDEPTSALDTSAQDVLVGLMENHLKDGGLIVAATHAPLPLDGIVQLDMSRSAA